MTRLWLFVPLLALGVGPSFGCRAADQGAATEPLDAASPPPQQEAEPEPTPSSPAGAPEPSEEVSPVDPKINAEYRDDPSIERWANRFERDGREVYDRRNDVLTALELAPGMAVADIGSGTGLFTIEFARRVAPSGRVFAVDVHEHFRQHVRDRAAKAGLKNVEVVAADQRSVNLPPASIDLAFMSDVYHHVEYPNAYLATLRRALKPGGRFVVIDFRRIEGKSPRWLLEHVRASPETFRAEIERAGFRFVEEKNLLKENFFYVFENPAPS